MEVRRHGAKLSAKCLRIDKPGIVSPPYRNAARIVIVERNARGHANGVHSRYRLETLLELADATAPVGCVRKEIFANGPDERGTRLRREARRGRQQQEKRLDHESREHE